MPLAQLAEAALEKSLPPSVRHPILVAAWTRAMLLDRGEIAAPLTPLIVETYPALAPRVKAWQSAAGDAKRFAAADLVVHFGAMQPYVDPLESRLAVGYDVESVQHGGRENWWCAGTGDGEATLPLFLEPQRDAAAEEIETLDELGSGPSWMLRRILAWARAQPNDARVPEALSLAIHGTRWACGDADTNTLARRAHTLLHKQYGATKWAKETKYWYEAGY
jgi:hypothetical protein